MAKDKYEKQLEEYQNYIDEDVVHQRSVNLNTLKGYLNQEKASLKKLLEDEEKSSQKDDDRLHRLVKKRNLEMLLR